MSSSKQPLIAVAALALAFWVGRVTAAAGGQPSQQRMGRLVVSELVVEKSIRVGPTTSQPVAGSRRTSSLTLSAEGVVVDSKLEIGDQEKSRTSVTLDSIGLNLDSWAGEHVAHGLLGNGVLHLQLDDTSLYATPDRLTLHGPVGAADLEVENGRYEWRMVNADESKESRYSFEGVSTGTRR